MKAKVYKIKHDVTGEEHVGTASELGKIIYVAPQTISKMALQGRPIVDHWMATLFVKDAPVKEKPQEKCPNCGKMFIRKQAHQVCCSNVCNRDMHTKRVQAEMRENTRIREGQKQKPRPKPKISLKEMVIEAEKAGMKYGEYVAMVECGMKVEK